jgi:RNA polymerase sigma-70 factor (sigma-E family)
VVNRPGFGGGLLAFAELISPDASTAEDLVQIALARVFLKWVRLSRSDQDPLAYARRIVVNENASLWRRAWKRRERPTAELPELLALVASAEGSEPTWTAVQELPLRQRTAIALRFYADLSVADTAAAMECSPGTVKTHTFRALTTLRARLGEST